MAANRVFGQAYIKIDGETLETDGQATLDIGGAVREAVNGDYAAGAFKESTVESKLECAVLMKAGVSLARLRATDDATVTFQCDTGQRYVINNGWTAEAISLSQGDGKVKLVLCGPPAQEVLA